MEECQNKILSLKKRKASDKAEPWDPTLNSTMMILQVFPVEVFPKGKKADWLVTHV